MNLSLGSRQLSRGSRSPMAFSCYGFGQMKKLQPPSRRGSQPNCHDILAFLKAKLRPRAAKDGCQVFDESVPPQTQKVGNLLVLFLQDSHLIFESTPIKSKRSLRISVGLSALAEINYVRIPRWRKRRHRRAQEELYEGCATKVGLSDQFRLLIDQNRGATLLNGPNALEHLGGPGEARR